MEDRLIVTASPHIRDASTTRGLMGNVVIALLPAVLAAGLIFGVQALVLVAERRRRRAERLRDSGMSEADFDLMMQDRRTALAKKRKKRSHKIP